MASATTRAQNRAAPALQNGRASSHRRTESASSREGHCSSHTMHTRQEQLRGISTSSIIVLVVLYLMQGVPLGLTMGSMPFLLQATNSYAQLGLFSLAGYPYSFKLFWAPIVDSFYSRRFGQRKSWIVPLQLLSSMLLFFWADWSDVKLAQSDVGAITSLFFVLVILAATQDIAVDGWALTLLPESQMGYASTCQTVGMNIGFFSSFTVFLALNDADFCNTYLRRTPQAEGLVSLALYMKFWGLVFFVVTCSLLLFTERARRGQHDMQLGRPQRVERMKSAYLELWRIANLPAVRRMALVLLTCRLGMIPAESASAFKLLEKGVSKEALAGLVLLEFPCELASAFLAGRWAALGRPYQPWLIGYFIRVLMAALVTATVAWFPSNASSLFAQPLAFSWLACLGLITSFTSTLMFTAIGSFFNRIADPVMGGTYLTLLNTIANMGVILPRFLMFVAMDFLTQRTCRDGSGETIALSCRSLSWWSTTKNACVDAGGSCAVTYDGFYPLSAAMVVVGLLLGLWLTREMPGLDHRPLADWRAQQHIHTD